MALADFQQGQLTVQPKARNAFAGGQKLNNKPELGPLGDSLDDLP
jgi:hypothetical protein